jgi:hypothetical protein
MRDIETVDSELRLVPALRRGARERGGPLPSIAVADETPPLLRGHSAGVFEFCSGLVDLVVCVHHHGGGGHRLALAGERFVGRLTEDVAEVGDRGGDFGDPRCGEGTEGEAGDGGRRFAASEPVEKSGEPRQRAAQIGGVAGVMVIADGQSEVIERGRRTAVLGLGAGQTERRN